MTGTKLNYARPVFGLLAAVLALGCNATPLPKAEPAIAPPQPSSTERSRLVSFGRALTRYSSADYTSPRSIEELVKNFDIAVVGKLLAVEPGRKEYIFHACHNPNNDESGGGCASGRDVPIYGSYVNLVVQPEQVLNGTVRSTSEPIHVERPWPNNLGVEQVALPAPVGGDVLIVGDHVSNARDASVPLEREGIARANSVAENLVRVAPYGVMFRDEDNGAVGPLVEGRGLADFIVEDRDRLGSFDQAVEAIATASNGV